MQFLLLVRLALMWKKFAERLVDRVETLECVAHNQWVTICQLCGVITAGEAQIALLRAAITWHTGTDPDDLLRDYNLAHPPQQEQGGPQ